MSNYVVDLYVEAYKEGFEKSTKNTFTGKKRDAKANASLICPEGREALVAHSKSVIERRNPITEEEKLGLAILNKLKNLGLKKGFYIAKYSNGKSPHTEAKPKKSYSKRADTFAPKYRKLIEENDFVPSDTFIVSLLDNISLSSISSIRYRLTQEGYKFEQFVYGWKVIQRPVKKVEPKKLGYEDVAEVVLKVTPQIVAAVIKELENK